MGSLDSRPIHVSSTLDTKTLFKISGDPRVRYNLAADREAPAPDVLLVPAPRPDIPFETLIADAPEVCWDRVRHGEALLVFDASTEGHPHDPAQTLRLLDFLAAHRLPRERTVMVTQDRTYAGVHEAWLAKRGRGRPIHVLNYDYFIKAVIAAHETDGREQYQRRKAAFEARAKARSKRFITLNHTPRQAKVAFLLRLLHDGFWDQGYISFGGFAAPGSGRATTAEVIGARLRASRAFGPMMEGLEADFARLQAIGQCYLADHQRRLDSGATNKSPFNDVQLKEHDRSWFTVVTETEIEGPRRITEKALKPLMGFHPTLVLGNAGALALIRDLGFRTFDGYVDEAYDEEPDPGRRFERVYAETQRLCRLDEDVLRRLEGEWRKTLTWNAKWGLTQLPAHYRDVIDVAFIDQIAALLGR